MPNENNTNDRFTAASHFFADVSTISQTSTQSFGPVSQDQFRLTAKFTAQAGTKAYSICPGIVAIQPQAGSTNKVNLILRPFTQPIKGVNIRYFIYRGLTKSDFIDNSGKIIPIASGVSDFIQKINTDFTDFHSGDPTPPDFEAAFIGYNETVADLSAPMDSLFFSITQYQEENGEQVEVPETAFELPKIDGGKTLGTFASGECGIDVVLQYGDFLLNEPDRFAFDYNYARAAEALIDLTSVTDPVIRKRRKEQLFQFVDIAAFYGFHCLPSGTVTTAGNVKHDASAIYSQVLTPFTTKNTYYLYIQSDRERSYDFYGTYRMDAQAPENMRYGTQESALAARVYGTNGWPLILETTAQEHSETRNKIYLQLVTDNNVNTVLYGQTACVDNALRNHFSTIEQLQQIAAEGDEQPKITNTIILSNPAVEEGSVKKHIANFGILIYQGVVYSYIAGTETNEENETVNVYAQPNAFDDVFGNLGAVPAIHLPSESSFYVLNSERLNTLNFPIENNQYCAASIHTLIVNDTIETGTEDVPFFSRVTYMAESIDVLTNPLSTDKVITADIQSSANKFASRNTFTIDSPFYYQIVLFTDKSLTITAPILRMKENTSPNRIILGLSRQENDILKSLCTGLSNPKLYLLNADNENSSRISVENITYQKFLIGIGADSDTGKIALHTPEEPITLYTVDQRIYFTKVYSDYIVPVEDGTLSIVLSKFY